MLNYISQNGNKNAINQKILVSYIKTKYLTNELKEMLSLQRFKSSRTKTNWNKNLNLNYPNSGPKFK